MDSANDLSPGSATPPQADGATGTAPDGLDSSPTLADPDSLTAEERRLQEARAGVPWRGWGPYLSERQWGTVREDYSDSEDAWSYFSHDQARVRAYRWGEDGIAGISDDKQRPCLALALWNERDAILKERLFGLTNSEGNHGEDVKEYYFYVDNLPTHSYQRYLYKYPQAEFPYDELVAVNRARSRHELEYELIDTGAFDDGRYFDVEVEHAKAGPKTSFAVSPCTTARRRTPGCTCCRHCGSATHGHREMVILSRGSLASTRRDPFVRPNIISSGFSTSTPSRKRPCCFVRTKRTRPACLVPSPADALPQGRHRRPSPAWRRHCQSRWCGNQGGGAGPAGRAGWRAGCGAGAAHS